MSDVYRPPVFSAPVDLDLSRNEGSPSVTEVDLDTGELATVTSRYPDTTRLRALVADHNGVSPEQVLVTAGGDDALFRCFLANRSGAVVSTTPSFEMIRRYAAQVETPLVEVPWWDGDFPVADFLDEASGEPGMAVVVSPNNPTGNVIVASDLRKLAASYPLVVLDAAYTEFADEDLTPEALGLDNVVVVRTLSKAYGLAGLRVGYALGSPDVIRRLAGFGSPYSLSGLSAALAARVLAETPQRAAEFSRGVISRRDRLVSSLDELNCRPMPSQANFVLATDVAPGWVVPAAAALGVGLRSWADRPDLARCVRVTVPGSESDLERLLVTLRTVLDPEALLFDMDGVLVDVSGSYREELELQETLLVDPDRLDAWSQRIPLGVVTARPRQDAREALDRFDIARYFTAVVAREDAASQPDPAPVTLALDRLGVGRAWMIGGTPDDLEAARAAGVIPIAVGVPGDDRSSLAGAARIMDSVNQIEEVLDATKS